MKTKIINAKAKIGTVELDCPSRNVELPETIDELTDLDVKTTYGVDSNVVDLFNGSLVIRIQATMRDATIKQIMSEYVASKK